MAEITQTITSFVGDAPDSDAQTQEQFDVSADALAARMVAWPSEYNSFASQTNSLRTEVNGAAATVESIGSNYQGAWSDQAGAFTLGHSVSHDSHFWIATTNILYVEFSEPSRANSDWMVTNDNAIGFRGLSSVTASGAVVTFDIAASVNFEITLTENVSFVFSNIGLPQVIGSSGLIIINQDVTGGRTFTLPSEAKTPIGGAVIDQVTVANTVSTLSYFVRSASSVLVNYIGDFQ